ncbi:c-type cytochrome [Paracoccus salsus]|uniref:c-type cytochrome n=1 Tax=Paracoccus salsus TaxID=2911061 RepID=UPI001F254AAD|nr:c-type cytochrome [Paracoccus salsus]MCF3973685.1 c-type cytochrome [Paracoccus salsus]
MSKSRNLALALAVAAAAPAAAEPLGIGREAHPEELAAWDVKIMPDGRGLPEGSGDVMTGEEKYLLHCAACHGDFAEGLGNWPKLAGGMDTLDRRDPVKTVGSYWPYLSTVWDYVHRSMPFGQAQVLTADETYAITAYILFSNFLVEDDFVLSRDNFLEVEMPNADGFIVDDRDETEYPGFTGEPCMENCKEEVEITMRASILDVTPNDPNDDAPANSEDAAVEESSEDPPAGESGTEPPVEEAAAEDAPAEPAADDEASSMAAADAAPDPELVAAGEKVFAKCKACHMVGDDAKNRVGPALNGVVGRAAGEVEDFRYSPALAEAGASGMVWDDENLHGFLADPRGFVPKNKMSFAGLRTSEEIDAVIAYLRTHP